MKVACASKPSLCRCCLQHSPAITAGTAQPLTWGCARSARSQSRLIASVRHDHAGYSAPSGPACRISACPQDEDGHACGTQRCCHSEPAPVDAAGACHGHTAGGLSRCWALRLPLAVVLLSLHCPQACHLTCPTAGRANAQEGVYDFNATQVHCLLWWGALLSAYLVPPAQRMRWASR